ncbi:MFS transporter [Pseudonocardia acaciae]|uniref:MFS transporter n=1 Tax=Pseudonocardia acaciae TaxID=551276 RepID=UPI000AB4C978|nr:MFS transporter [Pseudonocardia acaciae]
MPDPVDSRTRSSWIPRGHPISWWTLLITTGAILMTSIDGGILPAVLPAISEEFGLNAAQGGLINSVFFAGLIVGGIAAGWISDRIGTGYRRTWTWNVAMLIGIIGGALTFGFSGGFLAFLLLRIPMGLSRGGSEPINVALVGEWWPKEYRGFAVGVHHTGFPLGQFATGALIAAVLGVAGWREAFLLIPLLGIPIIIGQAFVGTRRNQERVYRWIDDRGLTRPLPELSTRPPSGFWAPVREAMRSPNVRWSVLLIFLFLWGEAGAVTFLTTQFVQHGMSAGQAALLAGASGLTGWVGQVVWGTLSDHTGRKFALRFLIVGWAVSLLAMIVITDPTSAWIVLLFWGLFRNAPFPVVYALLIDSVPRTAGTAMGIMIGVALGVSGLFASAVAGWIIDGWGFTAHYVVLAAVCLLGFVPLARITETVTRHSSRSA